MSRTPGIVILIVGEQGTGKTRLQEAIFRALMEGELPSPKVSVGITTTNAIPSLDPTDLLLVKQRRRSAKRRR